MTYLSLMLVLLALGLIACLAVTMFELERRLKDLEAKQRKWPAVTVTDYEPRQIVSAVDYVLPDNEANNRARRAISEW